MAERLGAMYHWSPKRHRRSILRDGLKVMSESERGIPEFPWICLAPTPSAAWGYLPASMTSEDNLPLDLWMVRLGDYTRTQIITTDGPNICEVRAFQSIPPDRIWWVAERRWQAHDTMVETMPGGTDGDG